MSNVSKRNSLSSPETCPALLNGNGTRERRNVFIVEVPFFFLINQKRFRLAFRSNTTVCTGNLSTLGRRRCLARTVCEHMISSTGVDFFDNFNNDGQWYKKKWRTYRPRSLQIVYTTKRVLPLTMFLYFFSDTNCVTCWARLSDG